MVLRRDRLEDTSAISHRTCHLATIHKIHTYNNRSIILHNTPKVQQNATVLCALNLTKSSLSVETLYLSNRQHVARKRASER